MNKWAKIAIVVVAIVLVVAIIVAVQLNSKSKTDLDPITSAEDLKTLADKIYEKVTIEMPEIMTEEIDTSDSSMVNYMTGLENVSDVEYVVVSEPMMSSRAYSLVLIKVKDGADANKVAKEMNDNINESKWVCVTADKIYSTSSGNVVCLVMSDEETAKAVYDSFKTLAGTVGEEYERTAEEIVLPDELLPVIDEPAVM